MESPSIKHTFTYALTRTQKNVALVSISGEIIYANPAMCKLLTGNHNAEIIGTKLETWISENVFSVLVEAIERNETCQCSCSVLLNQKPCYIKIDCTPGGEIGSPNSQYFMISIFDSTNEKRLESAESQAQRSRIMMESLGTICHAIGQPATVVMGVLDFLRLGNTSPEQSNEMIQMGYEAILELRDLLHQLNEKRYYVTEAYLPQNESAGTILQIDAQEE